MTIVLSWPEAIWDRPVAVMVTINSLTIPNAKARNGMLKLPKSGELQQPQNSLQFRQEVVMQQEGLYSSNAPN